MITPEEVAFMIATELHDAKPSRFILRKSRKSEMFAELILRGHEYESSMPSDVFSLTIYCTQEEPNWSDEIDIQVEYEDGIVVQAKLKRPE